MRIFRHHLSFQPLWIAILILFMILPKRGNAAPPRDQNISPYRQAEQLLSQMTVEERVGQLFLVTFKGVDTGSNTDIYELIKNYHIGGVTLLARNDNILPADNTPLSPAQQTLSLVQRLQSIEWDSSLQQQVDPISGQERYPAYIPLFIAMPQEGDGYPFDQILSGMSELPSQMAIGATWDVTLAEKMGNILGAEMNALGINLLLGPSLDVLDLPQIEKARNLGTRTFGGDPYWVGEMGRAYIRGVHIGSQGKLAVAAKHFPGYGGSDRLPEEEVATVRKSLDELKSFDLAPFLAVTGNASTPEETVEVLISSHIRYQGLQGNIRATTRPVSLDSQALKLLLDLPGLSTWRTNGGVLISDDLGNMAIRRFYSLTNQPFDARRVALNAFLAGNDLLYFTDFTSPQEPENLLGIVHTLESFIQKYREDPAFAQRVDESVIRILALKFHLYPSFTLNQVQPIESNLEILGKNNSLSFEVARQAATLLSPSQEELDSTIPDPPNQSERIIFISDTRTAQQCSTCPPYSMIGLRAFQDTVVRLYGPQAGGLVSPGNLSSFSFDDLSVLVNTNIKDLQIERELYRANWIVMTLLGDSVDISSFQVLEQFLNERPDLYQQKRLIVYAMTAPYFLDATNVSKLTAYYGLYSKATPFIDVAASLLFGELRARGAPPVSVPGIGYNLNESLFPNPTIPIVLEFDLPQAPTVITSTATLEPTPLPQFQIGDLIALRTQTILDHNGHPVPDGTPVNFIFISSADPNSIRQTVFTQKGVARTTFTVNNPGTLEIRAESENARSEALKLEIPSPTGETITPSSTPQPSDTPVPSTPTPTQEPPATPTPVIPHSDPEIGDWLVAVLFSSGFAFAVYRLSALIGHIRWGIRAGFLTLIGGLLGYSYLALHLPGSEPLLTFSIAGSVFLATLGGILIGLFGTVVWRVAVNWKNRAVHTTN